MLTDARVDRRDVALQMNLAQRRFVHARFTAVQRITIPPRPLSMPVPNAVPPSPAKCLAHASTEADIERCALQAPRGRRPQTPSPVRSLAVAFVGAAPADHLAER